MHYRVISKTVDESMVHENDAPQRTVHITLRVHGEKYHAQFSDILLTFASEDCQRADIYQVGEIYRLTAM